MFVNPTSQGTLNAAAAAQFTPARQPPDPTFAHGPNPATKIILALFGAIWPGPTPAGRHQDRIDGQSSSTRANRGSRKDHAPRRLEAPRSADENSTRARLAVESGQARDRTDMEPSRPAMAGAGVCLAARVE